MWNEEKLAKDIYLELNKLYPTRQLENIATRAETQHEAMVEALVEKYDINITNLDDYTVEYSDIDDLDKFIITAQENNATDLVAVFDNLKSGSYSPTIGLLIRL
jgi:hypothetical protein